MMSSGKESKVCVRRMMLLSIRMVAFLISVSEWAPDIFSLFLCYVADWKITINVPVQGFFLASIFRWYMRPFFSKFYVSRLGNNIAYSLCSTNYLPVYLYINDIIQYVYVYCNINIKCLFVIYIFPIMLVMGKTNAIENCSVVITAKCIWTLLF